MLILRFVHFIMGIITNFIRGMLFSLLHFWLRHLLLLVTFFAIAKAFTISPSIGFSLSILLAIVLLFYNITLLNRYSSLAQLMDGTIETQEFEKLKKEGLFNNKQNLFSYHAVWINIVFIMNTGFIFYGIAVNFPHWQWYSYPDQLPNLMSWMIFAIDDVFLKGAITFDIMEKYNLHISSIMDLSSGAKTLSVIFRLVVNLFLIKIVIDETNFYFTLNEHVDTMKDISCYNNKDQNTSYQLLEKLGTLSHFALLRGLESQKNGTLIGCTSLLAKKYNKKLENFIARKCDQSHMSEPIMSALIALAKSQHSGVEKIIVKVLTEHHSPSTPVLFKTLISLPNYHKSENLPLFIPLIDKLSGKSLQELFLYLAAINNEKKHTLFQKYLDPHNPELFSITALVLSQSETDKFLAEYLLAIVIGSEQIAKKILKALPTLGIAEKHVNYLENLRSPLTEVKQEACEILSKAYGKTVSLVITHLLAHDEKVEVRERIAEIIQEKNLVECIPQLKETVLQDPHPDVRSAAAISIGQFQLADHNRLLVRVLEKDKSSKVREYAAYALGLSGLKYCGGHLAQALRKDPTPEVRTNAVEAIAKLGLKEHANDILYALCEDENNTVREEAIWAIETLRLVEYGEHLAKVLREDTSSDIRSKAAETIGKLGLKQYTSEMRNILSEDKNSFVRSAAAEALGNLGDDQASEVLGQALQDQSELVRQKATIAVGKLKLTQFIPKLAELFRTDGNEAVQANAINGLGRMGNIEPKYQSCVDEALKKNNLKMRKEAVVSIGKLKLTTYVQRLSKHCQFEKENIAVRAQCLSSLAILKNNAAENSDLEQLHIESIVCTNPILQATKTNAMALEKGKLDLSEILLIWEKTRVSWPKDMLNSITDLELKNIDAWKKFWKDYQLAQNPPYYDYCMSYQK
ncbi:HEAT repeat domain-containing protein [Candidatus Uabimicrobium sp. HlEnr_7]|uniref:HEAT repeat domain-containing protein n=1 Tax=Candidatus Uabimicrobium helgolandensis TaxID=3095367 RepID=UPI003558FECE